MMNNSSPSCWLLREVEDIVFVAHYVLEGPFELGEPEIAKSGERSYEYARDVLKLSEQAAKAWRAK